MWQESLMTNEWLAWQCSWKYSPWKLNQSSWRCVMLILDFWTMWFKKFWITFFESPICIYRWAGWRIKVKLLRQQGSNISDFTWLCLRKTRKGWRLKAFMAQELGGGGWYRHGGGVIHTRIVNEACRCAHSLHTHIHTQTLIVEPLKYFSALTR